MHSGKPARMIRKKSDPAILLQSYYNSPTE